MRADVGAEPGLPDCRGPSDFLVDVEVIGIGHIDVGFLDGTIISVLLFSPVALGHEIVDVVDVWASV